MHKRIRSIIKKGLDLSLFLLYNIYISFILQFNKINKKLKANSFKKNRQVYHHTTLKNLMVLQK